MSIDCCARGIMMVILAAIALYCFGMASMNPTVAVAYAITGIVAVVVGVTQYVHHVYVKPNRYTTVFEGR